MDTTECINAEKTLRMRGMNLNLRILRMLDDTSLRAAQLIWMIRRTEFVK